MYTFEGYNVNVGSFLGSFWRCVVIFGYVKAYRPYLRVCELDLYKGVYCGLCKAMSQRSGAVSTLTLSYDFVFLTLVQLGINGTQLTAQRKRCPVHPIKKTPCVSCISEKSGEFEYSADASVILTYHKLKDDLTDKGIKSRLVAAALLPFYVKPYRQAKSRRKNLAQAVEEAMKRQKSLERERKRSLDRAAEPTAAMMRAVFRETGGCDPELRELLGDLGYMLGRYVYICDALDDLHDDYAKGNYNPLIKKSMTGGSEKTLERQDAERAADFAQQSVFLTLGRLSDIYARIDLGKMQPMIDNIVYLGLKDTFMQIKKKTMKKYEEKRKAK